MQLIKHLIMLENVETKTYYCIMLQLKSRKSKNNFIR